MTECYASPWSDKALDLIYKRYLTNTDLSVEAWLYQVCDKICQNYDEITKTRMIEQYHQLLYSRAFLPTSAALHNTITNSGSLAGCIVLPLPQDTCSVLEHSIPEMSKVLLAGIGVGMDLTVLPPRLLYDKKSSRAFPGPVEMLSCITRALDTPINYAGVKRAAFMATLFVTHPDIFAFIKVKQTQSLNNVNVSVTFDAAFLDAFRNDGYLPFEWSADSKSHILSTQHLLEMEEQAKKRALLKPDLEIREGNVLFSHAVNGGVGIIRDNHLYLHARTLLRYISESAHACGDPGLINLGAINRNNPTHPKYTERFPLPIGVGEIKVTTPCGEQPLLPYEVCHLGSFNLNNFVSDNCFDFHKLKDAVHLAVRFMDDLIDVSDNGLHMANVMAKTNRKIGMGIMGLADVFCKLEIPYDSTEGIRLAEKIMQCIQTTAVDASRKLANERGPFNSWSSSSYAHLEEPPRRNATLTTIAPTGHISTLADCSTSIEPYFLLSFGRLAAGNRIESCKILDDKLAKIDFSLQLWIIKTQVQYPNYSYNGTLEGLIDAPFAEANKNDYLRHLKRVFKTANEISPEDHLRMVIALQQHVENGISKTINLPESSSIEDVYHILEKSIFSNVKGITVFRNNCLQQQALFTLNYCNACGSAEFLAKSECGGYKCSTQSGGCGYEVCEVISR